MFKRIVNSVEIIDENKDPELIRVWFPTLAYCFYLEPELKKSFMRNVDRSNTQTKITSLVDSFTEFWTQMLTDYNSRNRIFSLNPSIFYYGLRYLTNLFSLVITIINLITFELETYNEPYSDRI
mmetsp:Transcript_34991/g.31535  ORF Transcript_34991/g.31535 Transcript_34991/m.31535 type:complete len:124 (+) Transcript_34991:449-820(+)